MTNAVHFVSSLSAEGFDLDFQHFIASYCRYNSELNQDHLHYYVQFCHLWQSRPLRVRRKTTAVSLRPHTHIHAFHFPVILCVPLPVCLFCFPVYPLRWSWIHTRPLVNPLPVHNPWVQQTFCQCSVSIHQSLQSSRAPLLLPGYTASCAGCSLRRHCDVTVRCQLILLFFLGSYKGQLYTYFIVCIFRELWIFCLWWIMLL